MNGSDNREFHYKDAHFHIRTTAWEAVTERIVSERHNLEAFIRSCPAFAAALEPLDMEISETFPLSVRRMMAASVKTGLGPMAAVAGTMAALAAETSRSEGCRDTIVENGGDIYIDCSSDVVLGLYPGKDSPFADLAVKVSPEMMPIAVCTSSARMGHSLSFGDCDIFTVFSKDGSLADAAATLGCNSVRTDRDMEPVLNRLVSIDGIEGALVIRDDKFGAAGKIPELIRSRDSRLKQKISHDEMSDFQ